MKPIELIPEKRMTPNTALTLLRKEVNEIKRVSNPVVKMYAPITQKTFCNQFISPGILSFTFCNAEPMYRRSSGSKGGRRKIKYNPIPARIIPANERAVDEYGLKFIIA